MLKLIECKFATDNTRPEEMLDLTAERTSLIEAINRHKFPSKQAPSTDDYIFKLIDPVWS